MPAAADFSDLVEPLHRRVAGRFTVGERVPIKAADHFTILTACDHARTIAALIADYVTRTAAAE